MCQTTSHNTTLPQTAPDSTFLTFSEFEETGLKTAAEMVANA